MAAALSLASAKITGPDGEIIHAEAQVLVRGTTLTLRHGGQSTVRENVQTVTQVTRGKWSIRFPDATELTVERVGRRCCGRR